MSFRNSLIDMAKTRVAPTGKLATLADVCQANDSLRPFYEHGLGAMKKGDRRCICVPETKLIGCTVALDEAAEKAYPVDNRWDYALEYDGNTFFIEIHHASTSEIDCVIRKVDFVKTWLNDNAPEILSLPQKESGARRFYWVSSGGTDLRVSPGSPQARKLALRHIVPVGKTWNFSKLFNE